MTSKDDWLERCDMLVSELATVELAVDLWDCGQLRRYAWYSVVARVVPDVTSIYRLLALQVYREGVPHLVELV